jgi:hypothetical protein
MLHAALILYLMKSTNCGVPHSAVLSVGTASFSQLLDHARVLAVRNGRAPAVYIGVTDSPPVQPKLSHTRAHAHVRETGD